jgi:anti-anti-sigma factor
MTTATLEVENACVIRIEGSLDSDGIGMLVNCLDRESGSRNVVIDLDLSGITDLSWQALGLLVEKVKRARERNIEVRIISWSEVLRRTASALGADKLLGIEAAESGLAVTASRSF